MYAFASGPVHSHSASGLPNLPHLPVQLSLSPLPLPVELDGFAAVAERHPKVAVGFNPRGMTRDVMYVA